MKIYKIIRSAVFALAGILVLIFNQGFIAGEGANINLYVGILMAVFGVEGAVMLLVKKEVKEEPIEFINALINILLAVIMIVVLDAGEFKEEAAMSVKVACVIWAVWSLMRVGLEVFEGVLEEFKEHPITSIINLVKMGFVVYLSFGLIKCTSEPLPVVVEDAHGHVLLLGVELILEGVSCWLGKLEAGLWEKKHEKKA